MRIVEVNSLDQFINLKERWEAVLRKTGSKNIFLTWEYLSTYWKHFGSGKKLRVLLVEDEEVTIGIAPLKQVRYDFAKPFSYVVIEPLGYRGIGAEGADYTDLIFSENETKCLDLILKYLKENDDWDFIYLMDIPEVSSTLRIARIKPKEIAMKPSIEPGRKCPYVAVSRSKDLFFRGLNREFRRDLSRCVRNLERDYCRVELKKHGEIGTVAEDMNTFFELHQKRWESKRASGVFNSRSIRNFYLEIAEVFAEKGWLALYFLTVDDKPIAAQYCYEYGNKVYYALGGFDTDYSRYSPGKIITARVLETCIERGIEEYDLLKGAEPYKFKWTDRYRTNFGIRLVNDRLTSRFYNYGIRLLKDIGLFKRPKDYFL